MSNTNKLTKYKQRVYNYLDKYRYTEECKETPTHLSYGIFSGKFVLNKEQYKEFMNIYSDAILNGVNEFSILEKQREYAPILIDIDLEIPYDENLDLSVTRLYDESLILNIIKKYITSINLYLDIPENKYKIVLLEKEKCIIKEDKIKDGVHIVFPDICTNSKIRHLIRLNVIKLCNEEELFNSFLNSVETIIDKAVVSTNAWFLYGSRKPNNIPYILTKIYNNKFELLYHYKTDEELDIKEIISYLSIQRSRYSINKSSKLNEDIIESDIDAECNKLGITYNKMEPSKYEIPVGKEEEIRKATKLVGILDDERACNYQEWIKIGLALHNIDNSLIYTWIEFSKKDTKKFKAGECEKLWKTMKNPLNGLVLTIRSLAFWAKQDNPKQYEIIMKEEFQNVMRKSFDGNTHFIAKSAYAKYSDRFVCSCITKNNWWEFKRHRWIRIEEGYTLNLLLSEDFANEYNKEIANITYKIIEAQGFEKGTLQHKRMAIEKIVEKLMDVSFKKKIIEECRYIFYDNKFEEKLDSNIHLIGFDNGVYDLENAQFREGRPDDYITLNTNNEYHKWSINNPYNKELFNFFSQLFPNEIVRKYFITALSTCLSGETKEEKLYILTGSGSNGKSLTMDLMYNALGEYYMSCPITIITMKRGKSNETSPEKVRMKGRRCGVFQETDDGEKLNVGVMKEFTGGDKILVRDLFKNSNEMIEFKPQMKYFLTCNQLPTVPSNDDGTWRRLRVINFSSKFTDNPVKDNEFKIDTKLKQKIGNWGSVFISYLIYIYNTEYKSINYLKEPIEVMTSTQQYKMENDYYTEYYRDCLILTDNENDILKIDVIYDNFKHWYKDNYNNLTIPKKTELIKELNKIIGDNYDKQYYKKLSFKIDVAEEDNDLD